MNIVTPSVAFPGARGAYSEVAVHEYFSNTVNVKPCRTLSEVFQLVGQKKVDYGIVPVENSLEGSVNETYDLLLDSNVKVCGEVNVRVTHCLVALPKTRIVDVKSVYSHPQALAQCRRYLQRHGFEALPFYDTAGSVWMVKEKRMTDAAAIASEKAASIYGMAILDKAIEDESNNYTRFFVLALRDTQPTGSDKTSVIFSAKHVSGSLYRTLEEFAIRNINLTKIESRPTRKKPWEYHFYLDFEGHRKESHTREALKAVKEKTIFLEILGSYRKAELHVSANKSQEKKSY